jgi:uncharacterized protein YkwD
MTWCLHDVRADGDLPPQGVEMTQLSNAAPTGVPRIVKEMFLRALTVALLATLSVLFAPLHVSPAHALSAHHYAKQAVDTTNVHRVDHDLRRLNTDDCLARFANRQAARMAQQRRIFHQDLSPVLRRCGLSRVGENVAYGFSNGRTVVNRGWMHSPAHRDNILNRPFRLVSVGAARSDTGQWYTAQVLGRR